jgi:zinc protease
MHRVLLRTRLDNGLTVVASRHAVARALCIQAWVGVGSADELPGEHGLAHVHEHMLFKGTARRGVGQIAAEIQAARRRAARSMPSPPSISRASAP